MAPLCADPRQVVVSLEPDQRQALLQLVRDIISCIISQIETPVKDVDANLPDARAATLGKEDLEIQRDDALSEKASTAGAKPDMQKVERKGSWVEKEADKGKSALEASSIQKAAVEHVQQWRDEFLPRLKEITDVRDNAKIQAERKAKREDQTPEKGSSTFHSRGTLADESNDESDDVASLRILYLPQPTDLAALPLKERKECISCMLLLLLATGKYSAYSRVLILHMASSLSLPQAFVNAEETEIAKSLLESSSKAAADGSTKEQVMSAEAEAAARREKNKASRFWKVGLASVAGATIVGVTGGLAAPLVASALGGILGGIGLGGVASFIGVFWMNGALVGALFGAYGAKMTGEMMDHYAREVEDFAFIPLHAEGDNDAPETDQQESQAQAQHDGNKVQPAAAAASTQQPQEQEPPQQAQQQQQQQQQQQRRLRVTIGINGWLNTENDITVPWQALANAHSKSNSNSNPDDSNSNSSLLENSSTNNNSSEIFALRYETKTLLSLGTALRTLVTSAAWRTLLTQAASRTALATLLTALWPIQLLSAASSQIDNPFNRALRISRKTGTLLADALVNRVQGERPVILIGYSLGAVAVNACLQELASRRAFGIVACAVLIGAPAPADGKTHWSCVKPVVAGPVFNVFSENDLVLSFVHRAHSLSRGVAGLQPIKGVDGVVNVDLSERVSGHLRYPGLLPEILRRCGFVGLRLPPTTAAAVDEDEGGDEDGGLDEDGVEDIDKDEGIQLKDRHHARDETIGVDGVAH